MIEELRIRGLGVIAEATLPLGPGFTAITGETGAGKTMVVTALGLLMGERADSGAVRHGSDAARCGGLIVTADPEVREMVRDLGGEVEDGMLTLTRTVSAEGRSRASIGGAAAPVGSLSKLSERLFTVHGQSDQLRLRSTGAQREMLDRFGGEKVTTILAAYREAHSERRALTTELGELTLTRDERLAEAERLRRELEEISAIDPQPGEDAELRQQIERLSNLEQLRASTAGALHALTSDSDDPYAGDAVTLVDTALRELDQIAATDPRLTAVADSLREISFGLGEAARDLAGYASDLDADGPAELEQANKRLAQINTLLRDHGADLDELLKRSEVSVRRLTELDGDDAQIERITARLDELRERESVLAGQLTAARRKAADELSMLVTAELTQLALRDAQFSVSIEPTELDSTGGDTVQLLLQPHRGSEPRPISRGASGGELSRVMLALEVVVAATDPVPTFVFDEVDAGVGGAAAIEIGRRLAKLAHTSQVIVVTHLAQVAAFANNHLRIAKDASGEFTESSCAALTGQARLGEMARLLSGLADSQSALDHAAELLELGASS